MKKSVYLSDFRDAFHNAGRGEQFSYEGLGLIFEYIEQYEQDTGEESELDVIALCCEITEEDYTDTASTHDIDIDGLDEFEAMEAVIEHLHDETSYIGITSDNAVLYVSF